jgi:DNA repair exonuclease SbcCD ATPase subunit
MIDRSQSMIRRSIWINLLGIYFVAMLACMSNPTTCWSQERKPTPEGVKDLELQQKQLAQRFGKLEELFIRMSELEATANPTRAGLLMQAAQMSKQLATLQRLSVAGDMLSQGQFTRAIQEQEASRENLKKLLELLQSENRSSRLRDERARIEEIQNEIRRLEQIQRSQTARTENGQELKQAAADQKDIKDQLDKVDSQLGPKQDDSSKPSDDKPSDDKPSDDKPSDDKPSDDKPSDDKPSDDKPSDSKPSDSKPSDSKPSDSKPSDSKPSDSKPSDSKPSDSKPSDSKPSDSKPSDSKPSDSKPSDSKPSDSKPSDSKPSDQSEDASGDKSDQPSKPESREERAKKRVQKAKQKMQEAEDNLKQENREEAVKDQLAAETVETRLRKMLELQKAVREETGRLDNLTGDFKERSLEIQANKLSIEQLKVVMEGQRALLLLQDEGSSTAFPEALEQVNLDAQLVSKRLTQANVSLTTQVIEDEVIGALEEMLESLDQVQKKREEKKKQPKKQRQQQQAGGEQEEPLVDDISEIKLLKTLQLRINRRTQSLAKEANNSEDVVGQVGDAGLLGELADLAGRQQKIHEVTRDILLKTAKREKE